MRVYYSAPVNLTLDNRPKKSENSPQNMNADADTTATSKPATRKKTRRPGAPIGNRNAAGKKNALGNKSRTGLPRPKGAGLPNLKDGEKSRALFFRLAESDAVRVDQIARNHGQKTSELIRGIIVDFLAKNNA